MIALGILKQRKRYFKEDNTFTCSRNLVHSFFEHILIFLFYEYTETMCMCLLSYQLIDNSNKGTFYVQAYFACAALKGNNGIKV